MALPFPIQRSQRRRVTALESLARGVILAGVDDNASKEDREGFAGVVLFSRNGESVAHVCAFTDNLRASRDLAPIVAIDQEGGRVSRLRDGVVALPSAMALGAAADLELAQRAGEQLAFDLRRAGVTLNLAPVLDLALEPGNTVIGTRSFGADPQRVTSIGTVFARAMESCEMQTCYKHFPGHGSTAVDSHEALPAVDIDEATLRARDVAPFAAVAPSAGAMMSAHLTVRALDDRQPATLSRRIMTDLLRGELGFTGALLTDCLEMRAIGADVQRVAVEALNAGADLLLFSHSVEMASAAARAIEAAVRNGDIDEARLLEANGRVRRLRLTASAALPVDAIAPYPNVGREIARRAVTLLRGIPQVDPAAAAAVAFGGNVDALQREAPSLLAFSLPLDPSAVELEPVLEGVARSGRRPIVLARRAHLHGAQADAIATVVRRYPDAVVVSLLEPFDLPLFGYARHLLATYGDEPVSLAGLADVLFGAHLATGVLPIAVRV